MLYIGRPDVPDSDDHEGYVSGRTASGQDTGIWTDVRTGAGYTGFRAGCECGWLDDTVHPADDEGHRAALLGFVHRHFALVAGHLPDVERDFMTS